MFDLILGLPEQSLTLSMNLRGLNWCREELLGLGVWGYVLQEFYKDSEGMIFRSMTCSSASQVCGTAFLSPGLYRILLHSDSFLVATSALRSRKT